MNRNLLVFLKEESFVVELIASGVTLFSSSASFSTRCALFPGRYIRVPPFIYVDLLEEQLLQWGNVEWL